MCVRQSCSPCLRLVPSGPRAIMLTTFTIIHTTGASTAHDSGVGGGGGDSEVGSSSVNTNTRHLVDVDINISGGIRAAPNTSLGPDFWGTAPLPDKAG